MIYTQYGSEVEILSANKDGSEVNVKFIEDGFIQTRMTNELKADDGINEIQKAINEVTG
jgi:hypothetical protein